MTLTCRRARSDEYGTVMTLLTDSVRWLRGKGLDQWSEWRRWPAKMLPALRRGDVWLVHDGHGVPVATVTVDDHGDPDFWTPDESTEPAAYLSKLAVRRDLAGREYGAALLDWAGDHAYRHGRRWVRLDAWKTNPGLHAYYRRHGWTYLRTEANPLRRSGALFQTPAQPNRRALIVEVPAMPTLDTTARMPEGPDAAGNTQPGHTHVGDLTVDNQWVPGARRALFHPDLRYRVRESSPGAWVLESSPAGATWWDNHGWVVYTPFQRNPGSVYVITHQFGDTCRMVYVEQAAVGRAADVAA